jgi:GNAT superfamily N-acetyltransferase
VEAAVTVDAGPNELFTTPARVDDAAALALLVNGAYRGREGRRGWTSETDLVDGSYTNVEALAELLLRPASAVLVVRGRKGLEGCVRVAANGAVARIDLLAVRPGVQGNQLGRRLLAAGEKFARRDLACGAVEIPVLASREDVLGWLERRGYEAAGAPQPYAAFPGGSAPPAGLDVIVMRRALGA